MAQQADPVATLMLGSDIDIKKEEPLIMPGLPLQPGATLPHPSLLQAFIPGIHQSFVPYPSQNYFSYGSPSQPVLPHFVVQNDDAAYFRAGYRFVDPTVMSSFASQSSSPLTAGSNGLALGTPHPLLPLQLASTSYPPLVQPQQSIYPPPTFPHERENAPTSSKKSSGGQKRAAALSTEICKALLGKASEFDGEVIPLKLEGNTPAERRTWFHQNVVNAGLYMISFSSNLTRRAIVSFEKSDKEVKYHATTWSKRAGQGAEAPYVYMRCCPVSTTCLARKYVVLFPAPSEDASLKNSAYKGMSVFIPGPEQHECSKNPAFNGGDVQPDVQNRFEGSSALGLSME